MGSEVHLPQSGKTHWNFDTRSQIPPAGAWAPRLLRWNCASAWLACRTSCGLPASSSRTWRARALPHCPQRGTASVRAALWAPVVPPEPVLFQANLGRESRKSIENTQRASRTGWPSSAFHKVPLLTAHSSLVDPTYHTPSSTYHVFKSARPRRLSLSLCVFGLHMTLAFHVESLGSG